MKTDNNSLDRRLQADSVEINLNPADFKYFNIGKHWTNKIKPVFESQYAQKILPRDWDSVDWRLFRFGRPPAFDAYVCHGACHWIVNTLLYTANIAFPKKQWRIVTSDQHSTVWDGKYTFFDMNYLALKVPVQDCAEATVLNPEGKFLSAGKYLYCH